MGEAKRRRAAAVEILPSGILLERNRPTEQGYELGAFLARAAIDGEPTARLEFPDVPPACASCAFRKGTIPNGCPETVLDASGCLIEDTPFMCHMHFDDDGNPTELCSGWLFARKSIIAKGLQIISGGDPGYMPAKEAAAREYLDEERRKLRAKKMQANGAAR